MYHSVIVFYLSWNFSMCIGVIFHNFQTLLLPIFSFPALELSVLMGEVLQNCVSKLSPYSSRCKESYRCIDLRGEIMTSNMFSVPFIHLELA